MDKKGVQIMNIREARSGKVSFIEPIVLYESSQTKVTVIPFYIDRSHGREVMMLD